MSSHFPSTGFAPNAQVPSQIQDSGHGPAGLAMQERVLEEHGGSLNPAFQTHHRTAPQNWATSNATDLLRAKRNTSSSSQVTDRHCICSFTNCSRPQQFGLFNSDKLLKFADTDFCVALQQLTQQWCADHQMSREVFLQGCILSNSLLFFSGINHRIWAVCFPLTNPLLKRSTFFKEIIYRKSIIYL